MLDDLDYLEKAFQEARFGQAATLPFSDTAIPTVFDKTLAPEGVARDVDVHAVGAGRVGATRTATRPELEAYADRLIERVNDGRARTSRTRSCTARSSGPSRCRRSGA